MWPDIQNSMLRMTSTCNRILEDRGWQELATPALRGFLATNGVVFRGKVKNAQLFVLTNQMMEAHCPSGGHGNTPKKRLENLLKLIALQANI